MDAIGPGPFSNTAGANVVIALAAALIAALVWYLRRERF